MTSTYAAAPAPSREARVAALIAHYADQPAALRLLLQPMPKGGDLHNHLDGSVYAEDYLAWADEDGFCVAKTTRALTPPPCTPDQAPARDLVARDPKFYQEAIDALSMRNFAPGLGTGETSGHDHAFATFPRFGAVAARHLGDMLTVTRRIARRDNVAYIEQISDPAVAFAPELFAANADPGLETKEAQYQALSRVLPGLIAKARAEYDAAETRMRGTLACNVADGPDPACGVAVHYLFFVLRTLPERQVFAQMALGFALAQADPRFVGVNIVAPEDDPVALRDFNAHMQDFAFLKRKFPKVHLSLHAGEVSLGLVPPGNLANHIRDSIGIAGGERIGHGYALPYEDGAPGLLAAMARDHIAVEINLTSNAMTPGIVGGEHPLHLYLKAGVPIVLAADDEGVFRIDLTHEYVRAVNEQHLTYPDLKRAARNSLEFSFLPGQSLWLDHDYGRTVTACATGETPACRNFLLHNEKAGLQWRFERQIAAYEDEILRGPLAR